jgi:predicted dehydrogenase
VTRPRIAVVGSGYMGALHAGKLAQMEEAELAGICDADPERAAEVAAEHGVPVLPDLDRVVEAADAACVAVPTVRHCDVARELIERGLDVLVEKPIATTRGEARSLIDAANAAGRILQVGHIERFSRAFREIAPLITQPRFIEAHRLGPYPARATDVGVVLDLMIHDLDIVVQLVGSEVERLEGVGIAVLSKTEDIANARVRFVNDCILNLTASRVSAERMRKIRIFQSNAYISIDLGNNEISWVRLDRSEDPPKIESEQLEFDRADALLAQDRAFAQCLRDRSTPVVSAEDGYRALDLALRVQESMPDVEPYL